METKTKTITVTRAHWDKAIKAVDALTDRRDFSAHCVIAQALTEAGYEVRASTPCLAVLKTGAVTLERAVDVMRAFDARNVSSSCYHVADPDTILPAVIVVKE